MEPSRDTHVQLQKHFRTTRGAKFGIGVGGTAEHGHGEGTSRKAEGQGEHRAGFSTIESDFSSR